MKKTLVAIGIFFFLVTIAFLHPRKISAQSCSCSWVSLNNCEPDDPSGCPSGTLPEIIFCGDALTQTCLCSCAAPTSTPQPTPPPGGSGWTCSGCIDTAIGCIDVCGPAEFVKDILKLGTGIGGGIAVLLIIYGIFLILTSAGNPEKVQAGKELITAAIAGLIIIIFAVFIMSLIGKDILEIPGFG